MSYKQKYKLAIILNPDWIFLFLGALFVGLQLLLGLSDMKIQNKHNSVWHSTRFIIKLNLWTKMLISNNPKPWLDFLYFQVHFLLDCNIHWYYLIDYFKTNPIMWHSIRFLVNLKLWAKIHINNNPKSYLDFSSS